MKHFLFQLLKSNLKWELKINKNNIKVYLKKVTLNDKEKTNSCITKTIFIFPFNIKILIKYLEDFNFRKKKEEMFKKGKIIEKFPKKNDENYEKEIIYLYLKMPLISDRDFVEEKKFFLNYTGIENTAFFLLHSIEREDVPINKKIVRGEMIINATYLKKINENETFFISIAQIDVKMSGIMSNMVIKESPKGQKEWIENTMKNLNEFVKENNLN